MKQALLALVFAAVLFVAVKAAPPQTLAPQGRAALSNFLNAAVNRGEVPGIVAIVVDPDGVVYHEAFGKLNVARNLAMTKDAIFRIASMTKAVTSAGVMQL